MVNLSKKRVIMQNNLNEIAKEAHDCAVRRGKISSIDEENNFHRDLLNEVTEVFGAEGKMSSHIGQFTDFEEELADVILVAMSTLHHFGSNIDALIKAKMDFNHTRND